ncbi:MAG: PIN domain-containing protein [Nitrosopumilus sp.]
MLLVVDANILFSAAIKEAKTSELLVSDGLEIITPEFIFSEFKKHKDEVLEKTHRSPEDFSKFLLVVEDKIEVIPGSELKPFLKEANSLSPDPDDIQYFAAALKYNCAIWSDDAALKKQSEVKVYSTSELLKELGL